MIFARTTFLSESPRTNFSAEATNEDSWSLTSWTGLKILGDIRSPMDTLMAVRSTSTFHVRKKLRPRRKSSEPMWSVMTTKLVIGYVRLAGSLHPRQYRRCWCSCNWQPTVRCHTSTNSVHVGTRSFDRHEENEWRFWIRYLSCKTMVSAFVGQYQTQLPTRPSHQSELLLVHHVLLCCSSAILACPGTSPAESVLLSSRKGQQSSRNSCWRSRLWLQWLARLS